MKRPSKKAALSSGCGAAPGRGLHHLSERYQRRDVVRLTKQVTKSGAETGRRVGRGVKFRADTDVTFCYGPRSCPFHDMGPPREVQYFDSFPSIDDGWLDDLCTEQREDEDCGESSTKRSANLSWADAELPGSDSP